MGLFRFCNENHFTAYEKSVLTQTMTVNALSIILLFVYAVYQLNRPVRTRG